LKVVSIYKNRCSRTKRFNKTGDIDYLDYLFYGNYFTAGEKKRLTSESLIKSIHGQLIVDNPLVDSEFNRKKMFKRITKSTFANT